MVHRFGAEIAGGSEAHCRAVASRLAAHHNVTILTTCAKDHVTWSNHYPPGESTDGPLRVLRFPVARQRQLHRFAEITDLISGDCASAADEEEWFRQNGPDTPELLRYLRDHGPKYDLVLFWAYRYAPTYFGVPLVARRAVLVPTAEADPLIHASVLRRFFAQPAGYLFLTPEEDELVASRTERLPPSCVIGCGLDPASSRVDRAPLVERRIADPFVLYLGRIDPNKGCGTLVRHFLQWVANAPRRVRLVMAGPANMEIPDHPAITQLGFVDGPLRDALLAHAQALVVPSPYESLSMVLLEGWNHGVPAVVNGRCAVLRGQVLRANGGLYYRHGDEFGAALDYLLAHPPVARQLGAQGLAYVNRTYRWPTVMRTLEGFLASVPAAPAPVRGA